MKLVSETDNTVGIILCDKLPYFIYIAVKCHMMILCGTQSHSRYIQTVTGVKYQCDKQFHNKCNRNYNTLFSPCSDNPHLLRVLHRWLNSRLPIKGVAVRVDWIMVVDDEDEGVKSVGKEGSSEEECKGNSEECVANGDKEGEVSGIHRASLLLLTGPQGLQSFLG